MLKTLDIKFHETDESKANQDEDNNVKVFDLSSGVSKPIYFPNQKMNAADMILTGDDSRIAIIWSKEGKMNPDTNRPIINKITLGELKQSVTNIAYQLTNKLNLKPGDAIGIDMPMNWESVAIYLGIIKVCPS